MPSGSGDVVGYKLVRDGDVAHPLQGSGYTVGLTYTDIGLVRDGSVDGVHTYEIFAHDPLRDSLAPPHRTVSIILY